MKTYIVAVSGGVDSVVLLDILFRWHKNSLNDAMHRLQGEERFSKFSFENIVEGLAPPYRIIIGHFDHGIRPNSAEDAQFVRKLASQYGLIFETKGGELGMDASEEKARQARYRFLRTVARKYDGQIVTAHHQDDLLETAIINLLRGTNRKGLTSLKSQEIIRPLLGMTKKQIYDYAHANHLEWREDPTNADPKYLRNYIRHNILDKFTPSNRHKFLDLIQNQASKNEEINLILTHLLTRQEAYELPRYFFVGNDDLINREIIIRIIKNLDDSAQIDRKMIENILWFIKTAKTQKSFMLKRLSFKIGKTGSINIQRKSN